MPRTPPALGLALLAACTTTLGLEDLDRLERSAGAHTLVVEQQYTLRSPLDLEGTRPWNELVRRELADASKTLGWSLLAPVQVLLVEIEERRLLVEATSEGVRIDLPPDPLHGVQGMAGERLIVLPVTPPSSYVEPDGSFVPVVRPVSDYARALRHEVAHVLAQDAGVVGSSWLVEGVAHYVESLEPAPAGGLVDVGPPRAAVKRAASLSAADRELTRLLDWSEDSGAVARGEEAVDVPARVLCGLFVRFLLEREAAAAAGAAPTEDLGAHLEALSGRSRAGLSTLTELWQAWLDLQIDRLEGGG